MSPEVGAKSVELEYLTWVEAEELIQQFDVVVFALGARTKEHGPHLQLNNDYILAEYLKKEIMQKVSVLVLPTLQYGYYPAFLDYPGSVSLNRDTFKNMVMDICISIANYGIKKFYILNTGISTLQPLEEASVELKKEKKIKLRYLNLLKADERLPEGLLYQEGGTHADEGETSIMLYIAPDTVKMSKAIKDYDPRPNRRGLTRDPNGDGVYSPTGIWGNPTLATVEKGKVITDIIIEIIISDLKEL